MKKKFLTYAGLISAIILVVLVVMVFLIKSPVLFIIPAFTVDPVTEQSVDEQDYLVLSGTTTLPERANLIPYVYLLHTPTLRDGGENKKPIRGNAWISPGTDGRNSWNATINLSPLEPGEYQVVFKTIEGVENFTRSIESGPFGSVQFILGDDTCTGDCIRKKQWINPPFIRINPVTGERNYPVITGITNLAPGTVLHWMIETVPKTTKDPAFEGNNTIIPGIEGINRWSVTSPGDLIPGVYQVRVTASPGERGQTNQGGMVSASLEFDCEGFRHHTIPDERKGNGSEIILPAYITIDAIPEMNIGEIHLLSGTTNLPSGTVLLVEILPIHAFQDYDFTINPRDSSQGGSISGLSGCVPVEKGNDRENLWIFEVQTYPLLPGDYEITVSNADLVPGSMELIPPTASCSRSFTLHGGSS